ncbi:VOC family protein [Luteolibacter luteus]|uniref:Glyoxalase n=1 Tax=Luteolibacter luteus TaxID=2728835 RepID=A0A858REQ3_9BACT|nr:VOC family protein [Luteolibacter luteus]QJE94790.1 glyoxalase [Luteolibacter luteus]
MGKILSHIDLRVPDLAAVDAFYRALLPALGFTEEEDIEGWLQFRSPDGSEFFGITASPGHQANQNRIAFWGESRAHIDRIAGIIQEHGARNIEGPAPYADIYYALFFEDPAGTRLEVTFKG